MANQLIFLVKTTDQQLNFEKMISKYLIQEQFPFILSKKIQKFCLIYTWQSPFLTDAEPSIG